MAKHMTWSVSKLAAEVCRSRLWFHRSLPGRFLTTHSDVGVPEIRGSIPHGGNGLKEGQVSETDRVFTEQDVSIYTRLVGDYNPLHQAWKQQDDQQQQLPDLLQTSPLFQMDANGNPKIVVPGMLVASLFSCVIGTLIPASIYVNQSIQFRKPVFVDDAVTARVKVRSLTPKRKNTIMLTCQTQVVSKDNGTLLVDGEANILLTEPKE